MPGATGRASPLGGSPDLEPSGTRSTQPSSSASPPRIGPRGRAGLPSGRTRPAARALVLLLDQFPRHLFRGTALAYASDAQARAVARQALARGFDTWTPRRTPSLTTKHRR
ncbi:MAG: DUF924 domain-containing protein [Alphaproteobacteria bacterium]|nr:DUF924 domain-containing protein [Alphaproteobacteria bacterium]